MTRKWGLSTTKKKSSPGRLFAFGLGGNLGDVPKSIATAVALLEEELGPLQLAPLYRSEPVSEWPQPDFLNTVLLGRSRRSPEDLLALALHLEGRLGRKRLERFGPRTIDIDLLFVGDEVRSGPDLVLPHPRLRERRFVLQPLFDLASELPLPPDGATVSTCLARLPLRPAVERWNGSLPGPT